MFFYETSAKTGENIKEAFESISREIIKSLDSKEKRNAAATTSGQ